MSLAVVRRHGKLVSGSIADVECRDRRAAEDFAVFVIHAEDVWRIVALEYEAFVVGVERDQTP